MEGKCDLCEDYGVTYSAEQWLCYKHWKEWYDKFIADLAKLDQVDDEEFDWSRDP